MSYSYSYDIKTATTVSLHSPRNQSWTSTSDLDCAFLYSLQTASQSEYVASQSEYVASILTI